MEQKPETEPHIHQLIFLIFYRDQKQFSGKRNSLSNKWFCNNGMSMCKINNQTNLGLLGHLHYSLHIWVFAYIGTHWHTSGNPWLYISRYILCWSVNFFPCYLALEVFNNVFQLRQRPGLKVKHNRLVLFWIGITFKRQFAFVSFWPAKLKGGESERIVVRVYRGAYNGGRARVV